MMSRVRANNEGKRRGEMTRRNDEGGTRNPDIQWFRTSGGELRYLIDVDIRVHTFFFL